ncbi:MAG: DUF1467 family protein [Pseudomonadota bacterium]
MILNLQRALFALVIVLWIAQLFLPDQGVGFVTGIVVFLITWWTVLFVVLPQRIRGQHESGEIVPGSEPGAPEDPQLGQKAWLTTVITSAVWMVYFILWEFGLVSLDTIPFGPQFVPQS